MSTLDILNLFEAQGTVIEDVRFRTLQEFTIVHHVTLHSIGHHKDSIPSMVHHDDLVDGTSKLVILLLVIIY